MLRSRFVVFEGSATVLMLERALMKEPIFDHERLGVYRFAIEYVAWSFRAAKALTGVDQHGRDPW